MTPEQVAECRSSLLAYSQYVVEQRTGAPMKMNWHQRLIADELERCVLGNTRRLIINVPPRSGKTLLAGEMFISWYLANWPSSEFIYASYSGRLAATKMAGVRQIMQMPYYHELTATRLDDNSQAKDEFYTTQRGCVFSTGAGGTLVGMGAGGMGNTPSGCVILDDPIKSSEAGSDIIREDVNQWLQNSVESRLNSPNTPIIVIAQRLHENDLPGFLLNGGNGEEWRSIIIPALDEHEESFWEEQFPTEDLKRKRKANPYVFAGQYMQRPSPVGGGDFKPGQIEVVDEPPKGIDWIRGWDLAATVSKLNDYTASVRMGLDDDGVVWIADVDNFKETPDGVEKKIIQTASTDTHTRQSIPIDPGQAGLAQQASMTKKLAGFSFEFSRESGDKRSRASPFASQVNSGNVKLVNNPKVKGYLHQLETFPNGTHDDMVDASSRAYNALIARERPPENFKITLPL